VAARRPDEKGEGRVPGKGTRHRKADEMSNTLSTKTKAKTKAPNQNLPTGVLLACTSYYGFCTPQNGPWHSDAQTVTELLAKRELSSASPSLYIRCASAIDQVCMTLTDADGTKHQLNKFGGDGGTAHTLDAMHLKNILQISVWGTNRDRYDTQRLGKMRITYTASSGFQPDEFGKIADVPLGSFDANGCVLLGFTGSSGAMVDGLSFLFAEMLH
jgi:hypothetical protein